MLFKNNINNVFNSHPAGQPFDKKLWESNDKEFEQRIVRIESILNAHQFPQNLAEDYIKSIQRIRHRHADKRLYLAIVGEFSSGKSTFINALLREKILDSDVIEGTTVIPTFIEHRPASFLDQISWIFRRRPSRILELVKRSEHERTQILVRDNESHHDSVTKALGTGITQMNSLIATRLGLDAPSISDGLVIIDTPGINSNDDSHLNAAKEALENWSDSVAILTPANQPLTQSLCTFIRTHLNGFINRIIVVATQLDTVRPKERERQIDYIKKRFYSEFGVEPTAVLGCAPLLVLLATSKLPEEQEEFKSFGKQGPILNEQFLDAEQRLRLAITEQRDLLISKKIKELLSSLLDSLSASLIPLERVCSSELDQAQHNRLVDLAKFSTIQRERYLEHMGIEMNKVLKELNGALENHLSNEKQELQKAINAATSPGKLGKLLAEWSVLTQERQINKIIFLLEELRRASTHFLDNLARQYSKDLAQAYPKLKISVQGKTGVQPSSPVSKRQLKGKQSKILRPIRIKGQSIGTSFLATLFKSRHLPQFKKQANEKISDSFSNLQKYHYQLLKDDTAKVLELLTSDLGNLTKRYERKLTGNVKNMQRLDSAKELELQKKLEQVQLDIEWLKKETGDLKLSVPSSLLSV